MIVMDEELRHSRISLLIHLVAGTAIGALSIVLGRALYALGVAIVVAILLGNVTERVVGKKKFSWWLGNGLFVYLFVWIDVWIFLVNYF
jgi:hypothetical protein